MILTIEELEKIRLTRNAYRREYYKLHKGEGREKDRLVQAEWRRTHKEEKKEYDQIYWLKKALEKEKDLKTASAKHIIIRKYNGRITTENISKEVQL